jgi:hypothetical protein
MSRAKPLTINPQLLLDLRKPPANRVWADFMAEAADLIEELAAAVRVAENPPESPDWATWRKKRTRADHDVTYEIEGWVPPEHAIGGKGYWTPLRLSHGHTWTALKVVAEKWFKRATATPRRLVAVERRVLETHDD